MKTHLYSILVMWALLCSPWVQAADNNATQQGLDDRIQDLKKEVLELNRDLFILEEDLLFPANTQFSIFLSMDTGKLFALDSVEVRINDKLVASHLYTEREIQALHRGGVQRLHIGNLPTGKHEMVAYFTGKGPHERDYRRGTTLIVNKSSAPQYIELRITDNDAKLQPDFSVKVWE
ncbi:MAG: AraC family transcriptional regulator [Gammaproteobacteria bacterium]